MKFKEAAKRGIFIYAVLTIAILVFQTLMHPEASSLFVKSPLFMILGITSLIAVLASVFFVNGVPSRLLHASLFVLMCAAGLMFTTDEYASIRVEEGDVFSPSEILAKKRDGVSCSVGPIRIISDSASENFFFETSLAWGQEPHPVNGKYQAVRVNHPGRNGLYRVYQDSWFLHFLSLVIRFDGKEYDLTKTSPLLTTEEGRIFSFHPVGMNAAGPVYSASLADPLTKENIITWHFTKDDNTGNFVKDFAVIREEYRPGSELLIVYRPFYGLFLAACGLFFAASLWVFFSGMIRHKNADREEETSRQKK